MTGPQEEDPDLSAMADTPPAPPPPQQAAGETAPVRNFDDGVNLAALMEKGVEMLSGFAGKNASKQSALREQRLAEARERAEGECEANEIREQSARALEGLTWTLLDGEERATEWTAGRMALFESLREAAGLKSIPGQFLEAESLSMGIFLFLAVHHEDAWELPRVDEGYRLPPLQGNYTSFLREVRAWMDDEFPPFDASTPARKAAALALFNQVMSLATLFRAEAVLTDEEEAMREQEEQEGESSPKTPAPRG